MSKTYRYNTEAPSEAARRRRMAAALRRARRENPEAKSLQVSFEADGRETRIVNVWAQS